MAFQDRDNWADTVRQATDIVEVVGRHVALRRKGRHYWGLCPFHPEKTPSFSVDPEAGLFYCFGCHKGGNVFTFVMEREGKTFPETVEELASRQGLVRPGQAPGGRPQDRMRAILEGAQQYFLAGREQGGARFSAYLDRRRVPEAVRDQFGLGYAPMQWDGLVRFLGRQGVKPAEMAEAGVALARRDGQGVYDRWRGRLMFPIWNLAGRIVGFGGRLMEDEDGPKYLNSPDAPWFHKGKILYGAHLARMAWRRGERPLLVEGYFDVLACHAAGETRAVATLGTALTEDHAEMLARFHSEVDLCYDADGAGQEAARKAYLILSGAGLKVNVVVLTGVKDPAQLWEEQGASALREMLGARRPFLEAVLQSMRVRAGQAGPRERAEMAAELRPLWKALPDPVEQASYLEVIAKALSVHPQILAQSFGVSQGYRHTSGKNRHNMGVTEASPRHVPRLEAGLVATVLRYPEEGCRRLQAALPEWPGKAAVTAVLDAVNQGMRLSSLAQWMDRLDPDARALVLEANAYQLPDGGIEAIDEYVRAIQYRQYQDAWNRLKERVANGERTPEVLAEVQRLQRYLDRFRMGSRGIATRIAPEPSGAPAIRVAPQGTKGKEG